MVFLRQCRMSCVHFCCQVFKYEHCTQENLMLNWFLHLAKLLLSSWHESIVGYFALVHFVRAVLAIGHRHDFYSTHSLADSVAVPDYWVHYRSRIQIDRSNFNTAFQISESTVI